LLSVQTWLSLSAVQASRWQRLRLSCRADI
jgi:hypothetical protein